MLGLILSSHLAGHRELQVDCMPHRVKSSLSMHQSSSMAALISSACFN